MPKRVQMTRNRPWRADHPDAVIVDRRSEFGNRFKVGDTVPVGPNFPGDTVYVRDRAHAVQLYRRYLPLKVRVAARAELSDRDLACWCGPDATCHADVLLAIANPKESRDA